MKRIVCAVLLVLTMPTHAAYGALEQGTTAHYYVGGAGERQSAPVIEAWILVDNSERVRGKPYRWWRMILRKRDESVLAVKALGEHVPMTSDEAPGDIVRYMYSPSPGVVLEYVDQSTGRALLPELDLKESFLPHPAPDARYHQGCASSGELLGHVMSLAQDGVRAPDVDFSDPRVLEIRTDFIIGTSRTFKDDGTPRKLPDGDYHYVDWTQADVAAMIDAGFNYFASVPELRDWMLSQPVFVARGYTYPDDLYRSNVLTSNMFIDEPMVRLGWSGDLPGSPSGPEMVAQALRMRVREHYSLRKRLLSPQNVSLGTLDLVVPKAPSWDTEYWSAWYQLQAGAPGIVHEGRYRHRGYGWHPEELVGEGVEALTDRDMFNFFCAFLRGAARSFDGYWGTSLYGHTDPELRVPAFIRAYQMGARNLWFWTSDHEHHMPFAEQLRIARAITDYAKEHPRPDREKLLRQAEVGIALPPGYAFSWNGTWGMERERLNPSGVSYGDISAAALWEGVLCSRKGIEYDYLVDHPGIEALGYKRLVRIHEDGTVTVAPPWREPRAPRGLKTDLEPDAADPISARQAAEADFHIQRAKDVKIDADLTDWGDAEWITLGDDDWFGDSFETTVTLTTPDTPAEVEQDQFLGFAFQQLDEQLRVKYGLEFYPHEDVVVVTAIEPGSPADHAGLREGDAFISIAGTKIKYPMHIHQLARKLGQGGGERLKATVRRGGRGRYGGDSDLSAQAAFMLDDSNLYFAAKVTDDRHVQDRSGWHMWMGDSVQLGFDPILDRRPDNYGENDHEIGLALNDGKPEVWRWKGRRGQPVGDPEGVLAKVIRKDGLTFYEAAIPLAALMPFAPDTWPRCGINIVINDSDGDGHRKGRLELVTGATTHGKHPSQFAVFDCAPSGNSRKVSAGLLWEKRCVLENGAAQLTLGLSSPEAREAVIRAELTSLDSAAAPPAVREVTVPVTCDTKQYRLKVSSGSAAGRYRLKVSVGSKSGWKAAEDALNVYIYPRAEQP